MSITERQKDRVVEIIIAGQHDQAQLLMSSLGIVPAEGQTICSALDLDITPERISLLQELLRSWRNHKHNHAMGVGLLMSWESHLNPLGRDLKKRLEKWEAKLKDTPPKERRWKSLPRPTVIATAWRVLSTYSSDDPVEAWVLQASIAEMKARRSLPPMIIKKLRSFLPPEAIMWLEDHSFNSQHYQYAMSFCLRAPEHRKAAA